MPFQIVRNDITKIKADIIVNLENPKSRFASGTDLTIYEVAEDLQRSNLFNLEEINIGINPEVSLTQDSCRPGDVFSH